MTREPDVDWAAARSDKWRRQLAGLEAMLAPIDAPLIDALALNARRRLADVGCGSGATTMEVWRRAPAGSVAHGFDLSPALIEVARRRQGAHHPAVAFEVADMESWHRRTCPMIVCARGSASCSSRIRQQRS